MTNYYPATELKAPAGTQPYTPWIWLILAVLLLPLVGLAFIDWNSIMSSALASPATSSFVMFTDPGYLFLLLSGWICYGVCALFAYLDWRELQRRGIPRPFHFGWVFLYTVSYTIGRSVVVRRRTGRGIAPMWVSIALLVASFLFGIYICIVMILGVFDQVTAIGYGT